MKIYKCIEICKAAENTEKRLNEFAKDGWRLICAYGSYNNWLIMEKEI